MLTIAVNGTYPKSPEPDRPQILADAREAFNAGRITEREFARAKERAAVELMAELVAAGVEVVNDGQAAWDDPFSPFLNAVSGLSYNPPRFPEGNKRGGQNSANESGPLPKAVARVAWQKPILTDHYRFLSARAPVDLRLALPGPLALATRCDSSAYPGGFDALLLDFAHVIRRELEGLADAGASYALIEEPELLSMRDQIPLWCDAANLMCRDLKLSVMLSAPGGDILGIEDDLLATPLSGIALDMLGGPDNALLLEDPSRWKDLIVQLGVVSGSLPEIEEPEALTLGILDYCKHLDPGNVWVAPDAGMDSLPREIAFQKLGSLYRAALMARRELARQETPGGVVT